jgi:hypothetical protein
VAYPFSRLVITHAIPPLIGPYPRNWTLPGSAVTLWGKRFTPLSLGEARLSDPTPPSKGICLGRGYFHCELPLLRGDP